ncbi:ocellar opsin-like [Mya arenaria]|uniref:ocellar opsin-like n=1 Tax=Mya arenaria TaxID=6604 RepID=UPI0022E5C45F|nr:ocellar opsin-like [Mya arenaria]
MNDSANLPNQLERWRLYPPLGLGTYIVIFLVIVLTLIVGNLGNSLVIFLFIKYKSLRTTPNILLLNLTGASLLMCVLCLPNIIIRCIVDLSKYPRPVQEFVCNGNAFSGAFVGFSGIHSLTALAIDRSIVISRKAAGRRSESKSFSVCSMVQKFAYDPKYSAVEFNGRESPDCAMEMLSQVRLLASAESIH